MKRVLKMEYSGSGEQGCSSIDRVHSSEKQRSIAISLVGFCAFLNLYTPQPLLPLLSHLFQSSASQVSLILSASTLGVAITAPWAGALADRWGRKRVIVPSLLLLAIPGLLEATSVNLHALIFWRFLQGMLTAIVFSVSMAYISEETTKTSVSKTMAIYVAGNVVGGFTGRFLAGSLVDVYGWRWVFGILAGLTLLGGIFAASWLPVARRFQPRTTIHHSIQAMRSHLSNLRLLAAYAIGFNILFSIVALFTYMNFYLSAPPFHLGNLMLGAIFSVYLFGAVITPIAGRWIDRLGYARSIMIASSLVMLGALLTLIPALSMVIVGLAISAAATFVCQSIATSYVGTTAKIARSSATGLYVATYYLGGSLGAVIPGYFWNIAGWTGCIILVLAVELFTIYLSSTFWKR